MKIAMTHYLERGDWDGPTKCTAEEKSNNGTTGRIKWNTRIRVVNGGLFYH
jgi:hypothetical protein